MAQTEPEVYESAQDLVALLDAQTLLPLVEVASPMRVTVREVARLTKFPVEDGTSRTDHRVIEPIEIELPLLLADSDVRDQFEQLRAAYLEARLLIMQTKVRSYDNLVIAEMPRDETVEQGDSVPVVVRLVEIRTVTAVYGPIPASATTGTNGKTEQQDTKNKGEQQTSTTDAATQSKASILHGVFF